MVKYAVILAFIVSMASASGSILLSAKLRESTRTGLISTLLYLQTFYFTFGFYAIWGQVILAVFLAPFLEGDLLVKANNLLLLLGSPFAVLTWFMLVKLSGELVGKRTSILAGFLIVPGTITLAVVADWLLLKFSRADMFTLIKFTFITMNLVYSVLAAAMLLSGKRNKLLLRRTDTGRIATGILIAMLLQNALLLLYSENIYLALAFMIVFFLTGAFIPLYLNYWADLSVLRPEPEDRVSFDAFYARYEISPREKEIIREICNGLSNQQIADKLFITLQTVKDHTSRIYFKTNCSGRAHLIKLVNEKTG